MRHCINKKLFHFAVIYSDMLCFEKSLTILNGARRAKSSLCALTVFQDGQFDPGFLSRFTLLSFSTFSRMTMQSFAYAWNYTCQPIRRETFTPVGTNKRVNASIAMTADIKMCFLHKCEHMPHWVSEQTCCVITRLTAI